MLKISVQNLPARPLAGFRTGKRMEPVPRLRCRAFTTYPLHLTRSFSIRPGERGEGEGSQAESSWRHAHEFRRHARPAPDRRKGRPPKLPDVHETRERGILSRRDLVKRIRPEAAGQGEIRFSGG